VIRRIDLSAVLRRTVCDLYSNLVTRPTGSAVRRELEATLEEIEGPSLTIIDFSYVGLLDFSCADEVIGKLLDRYQRVQHKPETYFMLRGLRDDHLEAIECVLERYDLALLVEDPRGTIHVVGQLEDDVRRVWELLVRHGRLARKEFGKATGTDAASAEEVARVLQLLHDRRLVMRSGDDFIAVHQAL
jgi:hypothetical protein